MKNYLSSTIKGIVTLVLISVFGLSSSAQLNFSAGQDITICQGQTANIVSTVTNVPNGETVAYSWISNPGNYQSNIANPTISNLPFGTYVFTGTATAGVSSVSDQLVVTVYSSPNVSLAAATTIMGLCAGQTVDFSIIANSPGTTYAFAVSDNPSSPTVFTDIQGTQNISHTFTTSSCGQTATGSSPANAFYATVIASNACGTASSVVSPITVSSAPTANFSLSSDSIPVNGNINVTNSGQQGSYVGGNFSCSQAGTIIWSVSPSTGWTVNAGSSLGTNNGDYQNWNFWVSGTSTLGLSFSAPGTYTITQTAANGCGQSVTTQQVSVVSNLSSSFTATPSNGCGPMAVSVNNTSTPQINCGTNSYFWSVTPAGNYFSGGTSATSENPYFIFFDAGTYTISLVVTNLCGTLTPVTQQIIVVAPPSVSLGIPSSGCVPNTLTPVTNINSGGSSNVSYLWSVMPSSGVTISDDTDVSPSILISNPGAYSVALAVINECGASVASSTISVPTAPTVSLPSSSSGCAPFVYSFSGANSPVVNTGGSTPNYLWSVSPNSGYTLTSGTLTSLSPGFNFTQAGNYVLTLTVSNSCGSQSDQIAITVNQPPLVTIPALTSGCIVNGVYTTSIVPIVTTGSTAPVTNYTWTSNPSQNVTFSIAPNSLSPNTNVSITAGGTYALTLTATNVCGTTSVSQNISAYFSSTSLSVLPPIVTSNSTGVNYSNGTYVLCSGGGNQVAILNNEPNSNPSGTLYAIAWGNPVGTPSAFSSVSASNVNLTSGNNYFTVYASYSGCSVSQNYNIYAGFNPFVSAGVTNSIGLCTEQTVDFLINPNNPFTNAPNSPGTTYAFTVSDNPSSPTVFTDIPGTQNISHTFTTSSCGQPGGAFPANTFYATVIASNACGTTSSSFSPIVVSSAPTANFNLSSNAIQVNGNINVTNSGEQGASFNYGGGNFSCSQSGSYTWSIFPEAGWNLVAGTLGNGGASWLQWVPGSSVLNLSFSVEGSYTITQNFANACGQSTFSQTVSVGSGGQTFSIQPLGSQTLCQSASAAPINAVVTGTTDALTYQWYSNTSNSTTGGTVLAGATSSSYSPPTASAGTIYYFCVVTSTVSGTAVTSTTSQVQVNPGPTFTTQPTSSNVCVGGTPSQMCVTYANGTGTPAYQWYSNTVNSTSNGTAVSGAMASCYTPPSATAGTTYYYAVINLSGGGCSSITSNTAAVVISPDPVIATQPTPNQTICVGGSSAPLTVSLQATTGIGAFTYQWYANTTATNSGGTVISGASSLTYNTPAFNTAGTFYYYCVVTDAGNGCGSTTSQVATVVVVADPTATISPGASYCQNAGTVVALSVVVSNGQGTPSYQWYSNTVNSNVGGTAISGATAISYSPSVAAAGTTYYYCMISQSGTNCSVNSPTAQIIVTPAPTFTIQPVSTQSVCVGVTTTQLSVAYSNGTGAPSYQWYSNTSNMYNGGVPISAATSSAYTPPSSSAGATYYYCVVSFSAAGGCSLINSNIAQVIVDPSLCGGITAQAEFSMAAQGCNPVAVTPVNTSILNPICGDVTYQWNIAPSFAQFVSGTNSSSLNPVIQFTLPGNYTVSLTLNSCGTITTVSHQILVETAPAVSIASASSCSPYSYMPGVNVAQADIISNTPVNSFSWSVNPNVQVTNSNSANPTIQFNQSGIYTIGLQVSNICGTDTDQAQIEIFGDAISYYQDTDNDSFGNSNIEIISCVQPAGYVANNLDCNDANASINPSALEVVGNGIDENCDGENTIFSYGILDSTPIVSCNDESVVIAVSTEPFGLPNYGLQWYFKTGNIASPAGSSTIGWNMISGATSTTLGVAPFIGTRTYACFVTPDASYGISGEWMVGAKVLTYNSFTAQTIIGNPNITPFNSYNYIVNPISGHTYSWSVTNGAIASGQGTNNVSIMWGQNGPYQVTLNESDGTCSGSSVLFAVNNNCNLTVSAASATTTSFCSGASVQLQAATTATNITYQWYLNGVAIAGETNQNTAATLGGNYQVSITQNGCSAISQVLAITELPGVTTPILVVEQTNAGCSGNDATVSLTDANYNSITWSNGTVNASSINVSESGSYSVTVTDNNGCTATSSAVEINLSLVDVVPICLVTVDQTTGKNNVVWEPVTSDMINSYVVLKETNVANVYAQIGTVAYGSNGLFEDVNSNPQVQANRYKLALIDTCGILSSNSDYHKTIHLTTNLGVGNNVNLIWSGYEGFDFGSYNIYRGASAGTMTLLTTIASNLDSYSDINPPVGEVYYMIEVEGVSCDPQRTLVYSHSNILDTSVGVEEVVSSTISLYPNPATTSINLQVNSTLIGQEYVVFDAIGKVIYKSKIQSTNEIIQLENFNNGNYFVKVNEVVKRIVVQH